MAMIQKIRDNSLLTFIVVGGAILAFIATDSLSTSGGGNQLDNMVGSFDGVEIDSKEFDQERDRSVFLNSGGENFGSLLEYQKGQYTNYTWETILKNKFYESECAELGLIVTSSEETEMLIGDETDQYHRPYYFYENYLFGGYQKYAQNREKITENIHNLSEFAFIGVPDQQGRVQRSVPIGANSVWIREEGLKRKEGEKYQSLLANCFFTTTSLAKDEYVANNSKKDIQIAYVDYGSVTEKNVEPTTDQKKAAYEEIKGRFEAKEASRKVIYAKFDLEASNEDKLNVLKDIAGLKQTLIEEEDAKLFVKNETDGPVDFRYFKKGEYPVKIAGLDTFLFNQPKGSSHGPFQNPTRTQFAVAKVLDVRKLSDSVKINLFVLSQKYVIDQVGVKDAQQPDEEEIKKFQELYPLIEDSVLKVAQSNGIKSISEDLWADSTAFVKGGDKGFVSLNDLGPNFLDSALTAKNGDVKFVTLPDGRGSGYKAIVEFVEFGEKFKKMQIGSIVKNVEAGDKTIDNFLERARSVQFAIKDGKNIISLRDSLNYLVDSALVKGSTYSLNRIENSRQIVNWAFNTEFNTPSNVFTLPKTFVVAVVKEELTGKYKPMSDPGVSYYVDNHSLKKNQRENILAKFPTLDANNFGSLPTLYTGAKVHNETDVKIKTGSPKFSREHAIKGAIAGLGEGKVSDVIEGENGIYVVKVTKESKAEITENTSFDIEKGQLKAPAYKNSTELVTDFIKNKSDLVDNRKILR